MTFLAAPSASAALFWAAFRRLRCSVSGQLLGDLAICFRLRTRGFNYAGGLAGFARLTGSQSGSLLLHDGGIIGPWPSSKLLQRLGGKAAEVGEKAVGVYNRCPHHERGHLACTRFRRHRVRCFYGTGGESWSDEGLRGNSSLRLCA